MAKTTTTKTTRQAQRAVGARRAAGKAGTAGTRLSVGMSISDRLRNEADAVTRDRDRSIARARDIGLSRR